MEQLKFPVTKKEAEKAGAAYSSEANKNALFPSRLRKLRSNKGVSQSTLAKMLGVSKSTIGLYETGDTLPDIRTAAALADYFGVSSDYLLGLCEVSTTNIELREICNYTRLSVNAVEKARNIGCKKFSDGYHDITGGVSNSIFNKFVESIEFDCFMKNLYLFYALDKRAGQDELDDCGFTGADCIRAEEVATATGQILVGLKDAASFYLEQALNDIKKFAWKLSEDDMLND